MRNSELSQTHLPIASLYRHAHEVGERPAVIDAAGSISYREMCERVERAAAVLAAHGVTKGDRVALLAANSVDFIVAIFAISFLGAIVVPINFRLAAEEVRQIIRDCQPRCLLSDDEYAPMVREASSMPMLRLGEMQAEGWAVSDDRHAPLVPELCDIRDDQAILYTSGTTGLPKGVVLSYANFLTSTMRATASWEYGLDGDVVLLSLPLFHVAGFSIVLNNIAHGATTLLSASSNFSAESVLDTMEAHGVTQTLMVPSQWQQVVEEQLHKPRDLKLRVYIWGASPASEHLLRSLREAFPYAKSHATFGQTETTGCGVALGHEDSLLKLGSVGLPDRNMAIRIVDEHFQDVATGDVGEILYRGPAVMSRFWNNPEATEAVFHNGWFRSGDLVRQDEDDYIYVVDRVKDMIISGGENIYSAELENIIDGHPQVREVAVIGRPDEKWGEIPVAVIVPFDAGNPPSLEAIREFCQPHLARYKLPKAVEYMSAFPRSGTGKIQKLFLRERLAQQAGTR